jgi:uridine phosphorylase
MAETFHLGLNASDINGATLAIVPGDPNRVERIAQLLDEPRALAAHREFTSWTGKLGGKSVVVCSTGIGGPSTSIAVEELAQLGVTTFLRVGTTGGIQPNVNPGDVIVTTGAVRLDGASLHFAPMEFPAVADFECTTALVAAARDSGSTVHVGITASSDTFYPGQERYDTTTGRVVERFRGSVYDVCIVKLARWLRRRCPRQPHSARNAGCCNDRCDGVECCRHRGGRGPPTRWLIRDRSRR